ncbi:type IV secretion system protein [Paenibacillus cremeus]|uniref:Type IV secretion system protein n=2 Tax=Paenibacillus cremeus TaxID=2163881 RepID=A0A559KCU0_9BACL|nr:type IV secretion system protein [Paenibacillus cremeus]
MIAMAPLSLSDLLFGKEHQKGVITELATNEKMQENMKQSSLFPSISDWLGIKQKIQELAEQLHQQALLTPDPNDDKIDFVKYMYDYVGAAPATHFMPDWFKEIIIYISAMFNQLTHNSVQFVFKKIYEFVTKIVIYTPEWIFNNSWFPSSVAKFSSVSVILIIIIAMIEGIKRMCKLNHTPYPDFLKRLPIALGVSAATPFIFSSGLKLLNTVTDWILKLGADEIGANKAVGIFITPILFEPVNAIVMVLFLILISLLCVPMLLLHARRWFDLTMLGMLTPLAMVAFIFDSTRDYFNQWLRGIKRLGLVQLAYAGFVTVIGILMFGTPNPTTFTGVISKTLLLTGGIYRLAFPPQIVKNFDDNAAGMYRWMQQLKDREIRDGKLKRVETAKEMSEGALLGSAKIAGKAYRIIFKKRG